MKAKERKSVNAFLFTCHQMKQSGFGKQFSISPTRTYRIQEDTPYSTKLRKKFNPDEWRSFLIFFRKLLLNDDPANLFRVMNILSRNGNKKDQIRLREIKRRLKEAETSVGYGIAPASKKGDKWVPVSGEKLFKKYINCFTFHNDTEVLTNEDFTLDLGPFGFSALLYYVIFTYKQALRIEGAIRIRYGV